jgi:hypothetical protein
VSAKPWIVHHRDGWCALPPDVKPDPLAQNDQTLCGHVVVMRGGHKRGMPTCPECIAMLACDEPVDTVNRRDVLCGKLARWQWLSTTGERRLACGIHARSIRAWNPADQIDMRPYVAVAKEAAK